ncbi:hypothetical protein JHK86_011051 [Glycine max]|nr:hypothetical protein JHK86_011051 [Glycine max]
MEHVHYHLVMKEEEQQQQQLQDNAALKGRQSLQHGKVHSSIVTAVPPSFLSLEKQPLLQKEELFHTQKEQKEQPTQKVEETSNVVAENDNNLNGESETAGLGSIDEFVENAVNGEAKRSATINVDASQNKNSVYFDKQQGNDIDGANSILPKNLGEGDFDARVENSDIQCNPCNEVNNQCMETVDEKEPLLNSSEILAATVDNCGDENSAKVYPNLGEEIDQQLKDYDVEAVLAKQETHDLFCPNCKSCITKRVILRKRKRSTIPIPIPNLDTKAKRDKSATEVVNGSIDVTNQGDETIATPDVGRVETPADNYEPEREPEVFRCLSCFSFFIPMRNGIKLFPSFGGTREPETSQKPLVTPSSNVEDPSIVVAASNANWFFNLFTSIKGRKDSAQVDASIEDSRTDPASIEDSRVDNPESPLANTAISQSVNLSADIKPGHGGVNSSIPSILKSVIKIESWIEKSKKSNVALQNEPLVDQNDSWDFSAKEQLLTENVKTDVGDKNRDSVVGIKTDTVADISKRDSVLLTTVATTENVRTDLGEKNRDPVEVIKTDIVADISKPESVLVATVATTEILFNAGKPLKDAILKPYEGSPIFEKSRKDVDKTLEIAQDRHSSLMEKAQSPDQPFGSEVVTNDVASDKQSFRVDATIPIIQDFKKVKKDIEEEIKPSVTNEKEEAIKFSMSRTPDDVPIEGAIVTEAHTQIYIGEQPGAEIGEHQEWEILKSIVYGGLVESITSLGVVSSAAAAGSAPLNIIALGLANLIGGLFVISHNLIDLKNDHSGEDSLQMNVQDRYQELLGRRANFLLHAVVAVLSFLIFGSVPLVVYGLLIRVHYYEEVKNAAVAATSVVCIILLAIGKVYTSRPPKTYVKTVLQYVTLALATSGISYIVGDLVKDFLEKISGSESVNVLTMPLSDTRRMKQAWMSY